VARWNIPASKAHRRHHRQFGITRRPRFPAVILNHQPIGLLTRATTGDLDAIWTRKKPPDHPGSRRPAAEFHTRGTPGLLSRIPKDGSENLPNFETAEVCGFEDVVNTTFKVSRPRGSLSSRGTCPSPKCPLFPMISSLLPPEGKEGKAGSLDKSPPVDAIHPTGRADTTDGTAGGSSRLSRVPRFL
jgi:hypothetical protein